MTYDISSFDKFIVVGDRLLVKPKKMDARTKSGLYLPPGVQEKESVQSGYVIKTGPGYPIPAAEEEEPWKDQKEQIRYIPLQAQEGDLAIYLQKHVYELEFNNEKYGIVPQSAVLMLIRDEGLFD
jgi:co-chaperonin GroES (HSP10)